MLKKKIAIVFIGFLAAVAIASCVSVSEGQLSPNSSQSVISIRRGSSGEEKRKALEIIVDGRREAGTIPNGGRGQALIMNGLHNVQVRIGKYQSQMLTIDCTSEVVEFLANFEGENRLFSNTLQLNLTKLSGGERKTADAGNNTPVINIQVDNSSSNSSSSSGNSSSNSVVGNDNSVN